MLILAARNDGHSNTKQNHNSNTYKTNTNRIVNVNRTEYECIPFVDFRYILWPTYREYYSIAKMEIRKTKHISSTKSEENLLCTLCYLGFIIWMEYCVDLEEKTFERKVFVIFNRMVDDGSMAVILLLMLIFSKILNIDAAIGVVCISFIARNFSAFRSRLQFEPFQLR